MKKIRLIIIFAALIMYHLQVYAQQMSAAEAAMVAKAELRYTKGIDVSIVTTYQFDSTGHTLLYEVVTDAGINVLISGNKKCIPVVGRYVANGSGSIFSQFDTLPCGMKYFLQEYKEQACFCFSNPPSFSPNVQEWDDLMMGIDVYTPKGLGSVAPLLTTKWGQHISHESNNCSVDSNAFNYYAPSGNGCAHCKAGCVAVAMAQIMNYWKYPVVIYEDRQFDWCHMPDSLRLDHPNHTQEKDAIAWLIYRCGVMSNTNYGCNVSTSNVYKAKRAFDRYRYNDDSDHQWRMFHRGKWVKHLRDNLDSGWVVLYGASGGITENFPSHAFVCDGYDSDGKFHFNWGWRGKYDDTYLTVDSLCPGDHDYRTFASALFDLRPPRKYSDFCIYELSLDTFYERYYQLNNESTLNPYQITPNTFSVLSSVPETTAYPDTYRTIPSGATAEYVAHNEVILQPGFTAEWGSDFTARIEPCALCEEEMLEMEVRVGEESPEVDSTITQRVLQRGDTTILVQPSRLRLHPNPASHTLTVTTPEEVRDIQVYDLSGRAVFRWYVASRTETEFVLDVGDIPAGSYILHVATADGKTHLGRFVKN